MPTVFLPGIGATMRTLGTLEVEGQVVGQAGDLVDAQAGLQGDLVLGDDRAGVDADDADVELEVLEGLLQQGGPLAQVLVVLLVGKRLRILQQRSRAATRNRGSAPRPARARANDGARAVCRQQLGHPLRGLRLGRERAQAERWECCRRPGMRNWSGHPRWEPTQRLEPGRQHSPAKAANRQGTRSVLNSRRRPGRTK